MSVMCVFSIMIVFLFNYGSIRLFYDNTGLSIFIYREYALFITISLHILSSIFEAGMLFYILPFFRVQKDVVNSLQMQNALMLKTSFNRPNIYYEGQS